MSAQKTPDDLRFMQLALALGRRGLGRTWPNPAVGAVIVKDSRFIARGWTQEGGRPHAEIEALRRAGSAAKGATLYVTLEPCSHHGKSPPCADAVIAAGIARVVSTMDDPNPDVAGQGHARLRAHGIAVEVGVGAEEARRAHAGHIRRMRDGRPHVMVKLAMSADGKVGLAGRKPAAITGDEARNRVHLMRAMSDAVLTGIGTVVADDPLLTCRLPGMQKRSPARVVLDKDLKLPPGSRLVASVRTAPLWVIAGPQAPADRMRPLEEAGAQVFRSRLGEGGLDLPAVLQLLADHGVARLMVEAGPRIAASFVKADLVDEAALLRSPKPLGPDAIDALEGVPLTTLTKSPRLKSIGTEAFGPDTIEWFERV
jgi:diaminohydroxyphosphoribosylaminopyrimidine deaminase/5-amino-6-(5-phosphoribosylamino)uracil reductase